MDNFSNSRRGAKLFDQDLPKIANMLEKIASAMERKNMIEEKKLMLEQRRFLAEKKLPSLEDDVNLPNEEA
jgi:hypothetical protein